MKQGHDKTRRNVWWGEVLLPASSGNDVGSTSGRGLPTADRVMAKPVTAELVAVQLGDGARCSLRVCEARVTPLQFSERDTPEAKERTLVVLKTLKKFADVTEERVSLGHEARLQHLAAKRCSDLPGGVVDVWAGARVDNLEDLTKLEQSRTLPVAQTPETPLETHLEWNVLARPFVTGGTLLDVIQERGTPPGTADGWLLQLAVLLTRLHTGGFADDLGHGVIHRDLTPGNVLIDTAGYVWLNDFGLARRVDELPLPDTELLQGTPSYLPPEVIYGNQPEVRSDIYQLGLLRALLISTAFRELFFNREMQGEPRIDRARRIAQHAQIALADDPIWLPCVAPRAEYRPDAATLVAQLRLSDKTAAS